MPLVDHTIRIANFEITVTKLVIFGLPKKNQQIQKTKTTNAIWIEQQIFCGILQHIQWLLRTVKSMQLVSSISFFFFICISKAETAETVAPIHLRKEFPPSICTQTNALLWAYAYRTRNVTHQTKQFYSLENFAYNFWMLVSIRWSNASHSHKYPMGFVRSCCNRRRTFASI